MQNPFRSFWWAGYECTDQLNAFGNRVDFLQVTDHFRMLDYDYALLRPFGIQTVREGIRWSQVEKRPYHYDWQTVEVMLKSGQALGIQQVWDICHFGYPDDLTPLHPMFARRFAALCRAFVQFYRTHCPDEPLIVTPINEVSFISWLGGNARGTSPYCIGMGWEVKYALMRAYIEGVAALREVDASIRILTTEPLINLVPPIGATDEIAALAETEHNNQFQTTDILCGRLCPELGGKPEFLDIVGLNYYYNNQWEFGFGTFLPWANDGNDPRWRPLSSLLLDVYERYNRPFALTETSHPGIDRPHWIRFVAEECAAVLEAGAPLWGICLYPIIDRPDWDRLTPWHRSGLWDAAPVGRDLLPTEAPGRILYELYAHELLQVQRLISKHLSNSSFMPNLPANQSVSL